MLCSDHKSTSVVDCLHNHDFYEIQYVFSGKGVEIINDKSYDISAGSIMLLSPEIFHAYYSVDSLDLVNICFYPTEIQKEKISFAENVVFVLGEKDRLEYELLYYLLKSSLTSANPNYRSEMYFDMLLNIMCTFSLEKIHSVNRWSQLLLHIAKDFSTIKLEDAAKVCNLSVGYFSRAFKKDFGKSFIQYLDSVKIEKAKSLLSVKENSIEKISIILGFSHQTRFYRKFKEIVGMTPKEYRNKVLREEHL